jgi:hypothetical protein
MRTAVLCCRRLRRRRPRQTVVRYERRRATSESSASPQLGCDGEARRLIDTKTFDCFVNKIRKPGDTLAMVPATIR